MSAGRGRVAPAVIDPLLALVERVDRWRRGISPVRPGALLGIERRRHGGPPVLLADGTRIARGDLLWTIHLDNARLRRVAAAGWQRRAYEIAGEDLAAIAAALRREPPGTRPVAVGGVTILAPLTRRLGFETRPRPDGWQAAIEDWYLRSLMVRWTADGRGRLRRGRRRLNSAAAWISTPALEARYPPPE